MPILLQLTPIYIRYGTGIYRMGERNVDLSVTSEIRQRIKSLKGSDTYSEYLGKLMRVGSKQDE